MRSSQNSFVAYLRSVFSLFLVLIVFGVSITGCGKHEINSGEKHELTFNGKNNAKLNGNWDTDRIWAKSVFPAEMYRELSGLAPYSILKIDDDKGTFFQFPVSIRSSNVLVEISWNSAQDKYLHQIFGDVFIRKRNQLSHTLVRVNSADSLTILRSDGQDFLQLVRVPTKN